MARAEAAQPYLSLDEYRKIFGIPLCAFNGVENPDETRRGCDHYWVQWEREMVAQALYDAGQTMANPSYLGFYLGPHYLTDEDAVWTDPLQLRYGHIIGGGVRGRDEVTPSASDFTVDPATITVAQGDFPGGTSEIVIIEDSTGLVINWDKITESGTDYVIEISQCKLIEWDDLEDQTVTIDYDDTFPATIWLKLADLTVYREYLDTSDQATITYMPSCDCWCAAAACEGEEYTGCVYVINEQISKVQVSLSTYSVTDESWTCSYPVLSACHHGTKISVNYQAGTTSVPGWKNALIRLAHTYMLTEPCGCATFDRAIRRDTRIPETLTAERINCPLGEMDGAWFAWKWMYASQHGRAFMLG